MLELIFLIFLLISSASVGSFILRKLKVVIPEALPYLLFATALGLGCISYIVLFVGLAGGLHAWVGILVIVTPALVFHVESKQVLTRVYQLLRRTPGFIVGLPLGGRLLLSLLCVEVAVSLIASYAPPTAVDALVYHLAVPKIWIENHRITYLPSHYFGNFPFNIEMLYTLGMLVSSSALAQLTHTLFGILLVISVYSICRPLLAPTWSLLAAALFYAITDVSGQSATALIDLGLATFTLLAIWSFWTWSKTRSQGWLLLTAAFAGLAAGTKLPSALVAAWIGIAALLFSFWYHKESLGTSIRNFAIFAALSLALVLPWYVKAWAFTGNPFYPFLYNIFGGRDLSDFGAQLLAQGQRGGEESSPSLPGFFKVPWDLTMNPHSLGSGEVGPLFLIVLPLAFVRGKRLLPWWPILILTLGFVTLQYIMILRTRWILPALAIAAVLVVIAMVDWKNTNKVVFSTIISTTVLWLAVGFVGHLRFHGPALLPGLGFESKEQYLRETLNPDRQEVSYADFKAMNSLLPKDSHVLLLETRGYYLERRYILGRGLVYGMMSVEDLSDSEKLYYGLKTLGITHIYQPLLVKDYETYLGNLGPFLLTSGRARELYQSNSGLVLALSGN